MNGHKLTAVQRAKRRASWWRAERARAANDTERAMVAWRHLRSTVSHLAAVEQEQTWREVEEFLDRVRERVGVKLTPEQHAGRSAYAHRRARVHAREEPSLADGRERRAR